jgi:hypothetical protein
MLAVGKSADDGTLTICRQYERVAGFSAARLGGARSMGEPERASSPVDCSPGERPVHGWAGPDFRAKQDCEAMKGEHDAAVASGTWMCRAAVAALNPATRRPLP